MRPHAWQTEEKTLQPNCVLDNTENKTSMEKQQNENSQMCTLICNHFENNAWEQLTKTQKASSCMLDVSCWPFKKCSKRTKSNNNNAFLKETPVYVCVCSASIESLSWESSLIMDHMER